MALRTIDEPSSITGPDGTYAVETVVENRILLVTIVTDMVKIPGVDWLTAQMEPRLGSSTHIFFDILGTEDYQNMAKLKMATWLVRNKSKLKAIDACTNSPIMIAGVRTFDYLLMGDLIVTLHGSREIFEAVLAEAKAQATAGVF